MNEETKKRIGLFSSFAEMMENKNSTLARFYRTKMLDLKTRAEDDFSVPRQSTGLVCPFCGEVNKGDAFRIRFLPKRRFSNRLQRILLKVRREIPLTNVDQKLIRLYKKSTIRMVTKCVRCGKRQLTKGPSRFSRKKQHTLQMEQQIPVLTNSQKRNGTKARKRERKKKKRASESLDNSGISVQSVSMEIHSDDTALGSPVICSTPKPVYRPAAKLSDSQIAKKYVTDSETGETPPKVRRKQHSYSKSTEKKSTNQRLSVSSLLDDSLHMTQQKPKKKKKTKDMHLQLQKIFKKDKSNNSTSSLKDFLSSV